MFGQWTDNLDSKALYDEENSLSQPVFRNLPQIKPIINSTRVRINRVLLDKHTEARRLNWLHKFKVVHKFVTDRCGSEWIQRIGLESVEDSARVAIEMWRENLAERVLTLRKEFPELL